MNVMAGMFPEVKYGASSKTLPFPPVAKLFALHCDPVTIWLVTHQIRNPSSQGGLLCVHCLGDGGPGQFMNLIICMILVTESVPQYRLKPK